MQLTTHPILEVLWRALALLALAVCPSLSPEPRAPAHPLLNALVAVATLALVLWLAVRFRDWAGGTAARTAAGLTWVAVAAALGGALYFRDDRAPLGRGVLLVALPTWGALVAAVAATARRRLGRDMRRTQAMLSILAGAVGALSIGSTSWLGATEEMWWEALRHEPDHVRAIHELIRDAVSARDWTRADGILEKCESVAQSGCRCRAERAEISIRARAFPQALEHASRARELCPAEDRDVQALFAETLGLAGMSLEAEAQARHGLALGGPEARLHFALALALTGLQRDAEAVDEARRALELGAGRNAALLVGAKALARNDLEESQRIFSKMVADDATDAEAQYNLALVADRKGDFNRARTGYLAALRADPNLAVARYNLALLTHRHGAVEEARHHGRKFIEAHPGHPRRAELERVLRAQVGP